jgi:hypothetical protein
MDEARIEKSDAFPRLTQDIDRLIGTIVGFVGDRIVQ